VSLGQGPKQGEISICGDGPDSLGHSPEELTVAVTLALLWARAQSKDPQKGLQPELISLYQVKSETLIIYHLLGTCVFRCAQQCSATHWHLQLSRKSTGVEN